MPWHFVVIDGCPVPAPIAAQIHILKADVPSAVLQSCDRSERAAGLLKRLHKSTQAMLYYGWTHRLPGYNPANPPGRSTHERRSDGVAYRGPVGRPLFAWQVGMDWNDDAVSALIKAARRHGWELVQPYKSGSEFHHLNFRHKPKLKAKPKAKVHPSSVLSPSARVSPALVAMVAGFEGFRARVYRDAVGVETIGYGETSRAIIATYGRHGIEEASARRLLTTRLNGTYGKAVRAAVKVPLSQGQYDALVSLVYNIGPDALVHSTLLRELNAKHYAKAANEFLKWDKAGGRALAGLTARRKSERAMFLKASKVATRVRAAALLA